MDTTPPPSYCSEQEVNCAPSSQQHRAPCSPYRKSSAPAPPPYTSMSPGADGADEEHALLPRHDNPQHDPEPPQDPHTSAIARMRGSHNDCVQHLGHLLSVPTADPVITAYISLTTIMLLFVLTVAIFGTSHPRTLCAHPTARPLVQFYNGLLPTTITLLPGIIFHLILSFCWYPRAARPAWRYRDELDSLGRRICVLLFTISLSLLLGPWSYTLGVARHINCDKLLAQ